MPAELADFGDNVAQGGPHKRRRVATDGVTTADAWIDLCLKEAAAAEYESAPRDSDTHGALDFRFGGQFVRD